MRKPPLIAPILAALLLTACASQATRDPASRYYELPAGAVVEVRQPITIPAGSAHALLQGGRVIGSQDWRRYEPYCEIEVNDVLEREQTVRPDRFAIIRSIRQQQQVALDPPTRRVAADPPLRLAASETPTLFPPAAGTTLADVGVGIGIGSGGRFGWSIGIGIPIGQRDDGGGAVAFNLLVMRLKSAAQNNVRELRCTAGWASIGDALYPTLTEMNAVLGEVAEIRVP